jgi:predicted transcriptional regulator
MEVQIVETVMTDLLEEQKETNKRLRELTGKMTELETKVDGFNQKLENQQVVAPPVDTKPLEKIVNQGYLATCAEVAKQPKNVIKQVRFQLFPETNTDRYYRLVLSWGVLYFVALFAFLLLKQYIAK